MSTRLAGLNVILGAGPVGRTLLDQLMARGVRVRLVTRSSRPSIPAGVEHVSADLTDTEQASRACAGATVVFGAVGMDYVDWPRRWPPVMQGMLAGAEAARARFVFTDNLYMYGPVAGPLHEDLPLTDYGAKPATRALMTRMWQAAHREGRVEVVAVRPSDFYGPFVTLAMMGSQVFGRAVQGKSALLVGNIDQPHTFSYVPDVARALITLAEAEDAAMGQAWHVPNAPTVTVRQFVELIYRQLGRTPRMRALPPALVGLAGLFNANLREAKELLYEWTQPYIVDHGKFARRFWADATPLEVGVSATVAWYRLSLAST